MHGVQPATDEVTWLADGPLLAQLIVPQDGVPCPPHVLVDRRRRACARQQGSERTARFIPQGTHPSATAQHPVEVTIQGGEQDLVLDREPGGPGIAAAFRDVCEPSRRVLSGRSVAGREEPGDRETERS